MNTDPDKEIPLAAFIVALGLLATGTVALPVGLFLLVVGELKYGVIALGYGAIAGGIAMFGSEKAVLAIGGLPFLPTKKK